MMITKKNAVVSLCTSPFIGRVVLIGGWRIIVLINKVADRRNEYKRKNTKPPIRPFDLRWIERAEVFLVEVLEEHLSPIIDKMGDDGNPQIIGPPEKITQKCAKYGSWNKSLKL